MASAGDEHPSVTVWIGDLKNGGDAAAQRLWERYCDKLMGLARRSLRAKLPRGGIGDEEDAALSAFDSFCRGARRGAYPRLDDRDDLWRLLVVVTRRKVADIARAELTQKRGGGQVVRAGEIGGANGESGTPRQLEGGYLSLEGVWIDVEPSAEEAAILAEEFDLLIEGLGDDTLRQVALAKLEGLTDQAIAERLNRSRKWVCRKLAMIRMRLIEKSNRGVPS
jgi:DNA-directed RNA polymerase specialized sigma24 family protein